MNCAIHTDQPATAYCRTCGKALCTACQRTVNGVVYCEPCLAAKLDPVAAQAAKPTSQVILEQGLGLKNVRNPNAVLAAILACIPGVGAMYNGQFLKGLIYAGIFATLVAITAHSNGLFGMLVGAFLFYMIFDAYHSAKAIAAGLPAPDPLGLDRMFGAGVGTGTMNPPVPAAAWNTPVTNPAPSGSAMAGFVPVPSVPPVPDTSSTSNALPKAPIGAIVLIGLGVLFLLDNIGVFDFAFGQLWPVILIAIGAWLFVQRWNR